MEFEFITKDEFLKEEIFRESKGEIQKIFLALFDMFDKQNVDYVVKVRKDKSIVIAVKGNENKNIVTITKYLQHLRLSIYKVGNFNLHTENDVDEALKNKIMNKYYEINKDKKQMSIYLDEKLINSIQVKAKESNKKLNDFVIDAINDKVNNIFLNKNHKKEFSILLKDAGLYSEDEYINRLPEDIRKRVMFFYLVSAYQHICENPEVYGSKFICNKETKVIQGPTEIIENWWEDVEYSSPKAAYGIAEILIHKQDFDSLFDIFSESGSIEELGKLFVNALKLLNGFYTIKNDDIVRPQVAHFNISDCIKF